MPDAGKDHCYVVLIGRFNDFRVADRAARFNNCRRTDFDRFQQSVRKRKVCIGCNRAAM